MSITSNVAYVNKIIKKTLDKLPKAMYSIAISNRKELKMLSKSREKLKSDIENITDEATIEKVKIFIMGILAQKAIAHESTAKSESTAQQAS